MNNKDIYDFLTNILKGPAYKYVITNTRDKWQHTSLKGKPNFKIIYLHQLLPYLVNFHQRMEQTNLDMFQNQ